MLGCSGEDCFSKKKAVTCLVALVGKSSQKRTQT